MKFVILIPTFNESANIVSLLNELEKIRSRCTYLFDVLVIDDNSPDDTANIVLKLDLPWVDVLRRPEKKGLGPAYRAGLEGVLSTKKYTHIVTMDADGSHRPIDLISLFNAVVPGQMVVLGTRWMPGGSVVNWPRRRQLLSRAATAFARKALGIGLNDLTGGFRIYSVDLLQRLQLSTMNANGYCFQIEMALASHLAGALMIQVPITFVERINGVSKMSGDIVREALIQTTIWGLRRLVRPNADKLHYVK